MNDEGTTIVKINLKCGIWTLAIAMSLGLGGGAAIGAPFFQDQGPDYSNNKVYKQGMREGQSDHARNRDHSKKRHFKKDEDQKAYEAGYQKGHGN
jgi:hypothetical protein